jgi:hypothetical protein
MRKDSKRKRMKKNKVNFYIYNIYYTQLQLQPHIALVSRCRSVLVHLKQLKQNITARLVINFQDIIMTMLESLLKKYGISAGLTSIDHGDRKSSLLCYQCDSETGKDRQSRSNEKNTITFI